jgi:DNA-directed RNA polymerase subunit L
MSFKNIVATSNNKLKFTIVNVDVSILNAIRRIGLAEVECAAFYFDTYDQEKKYINIISNTGVLHNEFLAHRISLLPLYFNLDEIKNFEKFTNYKFVINKKNTSNDTLLITTQDFEIYDENEKKQPETFREHIFPKNPITNDYILITKLRPNLYDNIKGEELHVECKPMIGTASEHARWMPASQFVYYNTVDPVAAEKAFTESCKNLSIEDRKKKEIQFDILDKDLYFKKNKYDEPNEFEFKIQSECGMTPKQIFNEAIIILENKIMTFKDNIDELLITNLGDMSNFYQIEIKNQNHTLLNILHALIYNKCFRNPENPILYIGFHETHPLANVMFLKIKFVSEENTDVKEFLTHYCEDIITDINALKVEWSKI